MPVPPSTMTSRPAYSLELVADADDGRDAHGAGENGGVAGAGAAGSDEAEDFRFVELDGLAGGKVVGGEDDGHGAVDTALHRAGQDAEDATGDVLDVGGAGLHVGIVHRGEHLRELSGHVADDGLEVEALLVDFFLNGLYIVEVLRHHLVHLEERGCLVSGLDPRLLGQRAELFDGFGLRGLKALPLRVPVLDGVAADLAFRALIKIERSGGDAGGGALSLDRDHIGFSF